MSPLELVLAGTALEVAYFLFEVPTAIVADTYSRRASIVVGAVIMGLAYVATGLAPGVGLTIVTWLSRVAFLAAPPLVGILVEATTLRSAMVVIPVAGLLAILAALVIAGGRAEAASTPR